MADNLTLDWEALPSTSTRLGAAATAVALALTGHVVDISKVARVAGVSRQALHKDHKPVIELIGRLKTHSIAPGAVAAGAGPAELTELRSALARERDARREVERQRDLALHHLELAVATLGALREDAGRVVPFDGRRHKPVVQSRRKS